MLGYGLFTQHIHGPLNKYMWMSCRGYAFLPRLLLFQQALSLWPLIFSSTVRFLSNLQTSKPAKDLVFTKIMNLPISSVSWMRAWASLLPTSFPTCIIRWSNFVSQWPSLIVKPFSPSSPTSCQGLKRCLAVCGEARARQLLAHTQLTSLQPSSARWDDDQSRKLEVEVFHELIFDVFCCFHRDP